MKIRMVITLFLVAAGCLAATLMPPYPAAGANPDVGLVLQVQGEVSYAGVEEGKPGKVQAFMKIRQGDRLQVPAGAAIKLVYFSAQGRQELWRGPVEVECDGRPTIHHVDADGHGTGIGVALATHLTSALWQTYGTRARMERRVSLSV